MSVNTLLIGDTIYDITPAYINGAQAMRDNVTCHANPHRHGSQRYNDWDCGHTHEAAGLHQFDDIDVIKTKEKNKEFVIPEHIVNEH